jgi:DNA-binding IclR family transcriptional regulator
MSLALSAPASADDAPIEEKSRSGIQSIEVGFRLLDVLTKEPRAMMLRDLAQRAAMSPAKAHRYLVSFQRLGVVSQDPVSGRYELGGFALQMGLARLARVDGVKLARIALTGLRDRLDLTVGIAVWGNQGPTVVHWIESSHPAKASLKLGDVMPLLSSATGLLFAAYMPRGKTQAMLERELAASRRSLEDVEPLLGDVREHGAAGRHAAAHHPCVLHAGLRFHRRPRARPDRTGSRRLVRYALGRRRRHRLAGMHGTAFVRARIHARRTLTSAEHRAVCPGHTRNSCAMRLLPFVRFHSFGSLWHSHRHLQVTDAFLHASPSLCPVGQTD